MLDRSGTKTGGTNPRHSALAFTLPEMLAVVAVVTIIIAIMLPAFGRSRQTTHRAVCLTSLHSIHQASLAYAAANKGKLPDGYTTGNHSYRMQTGKVTANDPAALPESYGWAATLEKFYFMPPRDPIWVCPAALPWMQSVGNTYAFSIATNFSTSFSKTILLWDNHSFYPGLSGFRGKFSGYTIPKAAQFFPHPMASDDADDYGVAALYIGGNVQVRSELD